MIYDESTRQDVVVAYLWSTDRNGLGYRASEVTLRPSGALYICPISNVIDCGTGYRFGRFEAPAHGRTVALVAIERAYGDDFERVQTGD